MIYDAYGRPLPDEATPPPRAGLHAVWQESDRSHLSTVGRGLTPEAVDAIMQAADSGDTARLCALAERIDDLSLAIGAALDTRRAAIAATKWHLEAGDESGRADEIAQAAEQMLRQTHPGGELLTFGQMVRLELGSALLPGFAAPEIVWGKNGGDILGYSSVPQKHFTFVGSRTPLLVTSDRSEGMPLPPGKFVLHWHRAKGGAPTRGGLIRAAAWLRCFEAVNVKDLLRFIERYGMPFLVARVDEQSWKNERTVLRAIVRNFGPDGGAVLSRNTELDLLQAANNTGDVYFRLLEYVERAAEKLILGQTGTSGEGGWSNNGAQHMVRMDIRDSDCGQIAETVYARILVPWVRWNYGPEAPVPCMVYDVEEAKDTQAEANVVKTLGEAGWELDAEQVEANTGYRVTRKAAPDADAAALSAEEVQGWRRLLAGLAHGVVAPLDSGDRGSDAPERIAAAALPQARKAALGMFEGVQDRLDALAAVEDAAAFRQAAVALSADLVGMAGGDGAEDLARVIAETVYGATAAGTAAHAGTLSRREGR